MTTPWIGGGGGMSPDHGRGLMCEPEVVNEDDEECKRMHKAWVTKLLDDDSRRNSLTDPIPIPGQVKGHSIVDVNQNIMFNQQRSEVETLSEEFTTSFKVGNPLASGHSSSSQLLSQFEIGSRDSGYISPIVSVPNPDPPPAAPLPFSKVPMERPLPLPVMTQQASQIDPSPLSDALISPPPPLAQLGGQMGRCPQQQVGNISGPPPPAVSLAPAAAVQYPTNKTTELRPIFKSDQANSNHRQSVHYAPKADRGHLRPVDHIVCNVMAAVRPADPDALPSLPPPEYIKNIPPPLPASLMDQRSHPAANKAHQAGFRPVSRAWNVMRTPVKVPRPKASVYKTNSSWVKVPTSQQQQLSSKVQYSNPPPLVPAKKPMPLMMAPPPPVPPSLPPNTRTKPPGPAAELHLRLEQAIDHFKRLERDRKVTEADMTRLFPNKKVTSSGVNYQNLPRLPLNATRVDRVICENLREHARMTMLMKRMDRLVTAAAAADPRHNKAARPPLPSEQPSSGLEVRNPNKNLSAWKDAIELVRQKRTDELQAAAKSGDKGRLITALALSLAQLSGSIKRVRTSLWCAMQTAISTTQIEK